MTTYAEIRITHLVEGWHTDPAAPTLTPQGGGRDCADRPSPRASEAACRPST
jgi:hypothetical protein